MMFCTFSLKNIFEIAFMWNLICEPHNTSNNNNNLASCYKMVLVPQHFKQSKLLFTGHLVYTAGDGASGRWQGGWTDKGLNNLLVGWIR